MTSYTTLEVQNFKGIREMTLDGLGMVNVFVGDNNVGKTSVLQAIAVAKNTEGVPSDFISRYLDDEIPFKNQVDYNLSLFGTATRLNLATFNYQKNSKLPVKINMVSLSEKENEKITITQEGTEAVKFNIEKSRFVYGTYSAFVENDENESLSSVNINPSTLYYSSVLFKKNVSDPEDVHFTNYISTDLYFYEALATKFFDVLERDNPLVCDRIVDELKKIQKDLIRIKVTNGVTECYLRSSEKWLALNAMGEGFVKFLGLLVAIQESKASVLLIDEIENGFHWSVQKDMWRMILQAAKDDGTQFFITTHSYEVLESLNAVLQEITAEWKGENAQNYKEVLNTEWDEDGELQSKILVGESQQEVDLACVFKLVKSDSDKVTPFKYMGKKLETFIRLREELR